MWQSHTFYDRDRIGHRPWICGELEGEQGVLKQLRINWNPNNKLLAPHFIKMLCFSTTALQSRPKQKSKISHSPILLFWQFSTVARFASVRTLAINWQNLSGLIVNFVWGHAPNPPVILKGGESPFKTKIQTASAAIFSLTFSRCYMWCWRLLPFKVSFKLNIV